MNSTHAIFFISPRISATSHCITMVQPRYVTDVDRGRAIAWLQQRIAVLEVARRPGVAPSVICRLATALAGDRKSARQAPVRSTLKDHQMGGSLHHKPSDNGTNQHRQAHQRAAEGSDTNQRVRVHHKNSPPRSPPPCPSPSKAAKADPCPQKGTPGLTQAPCAVDTCPLVQGDVYQ